MVYVSGPQSWRKSPIGPSKCLSGPIISDSENWQTGIGYVQSWEEFPIAPSAGAHISKGAWVTWHRDVIDYDVPPLQGLYVNTLFVSGACKLCRRIPLPLLQTVCLLILHLKQNCLVVWFNRLWPHKSNANGQHPLNELPAYLTLSSCLWHVSW